MACWQGFMHWLPGADHVDLPSETSQHAQGSPAPTGSAPASVRLQHCSCSRRTHRQRKQQVLLTHVKTSGNAKMKEEK